MYRTPTFHSLIDYITVSVDVFEGKDRKRIFSELKTFSAKQVYFTDFFDKIKSELKLSDTEMLFISQSLIKVENILSHLKGIPLYTDVSQNEGNNLFFSQFTVPFVKQLCSLTSEYTGSVFFCSLEKFLFSKKECNGLKDIISLVKSEILDELNHIDASSVTELKLALSKLDERSFPTRSSIKKHVDMLSQNILLIEGEDKANSVSSRIYMIFFAAKVAFVFAKFKKGAHIEEANIDPEIVHLFLLFNKEYTFNAEVSSEDDSYIENVKFRDCKSYFLDKINQEDPVSFLKENGTRALCEYKNGIFFSYAIREKLLWDISKGRYSEGGINEFIKTFIPKLSKRQSGSDGVGIAVILMGMKVMLSKNIANNSLEPLINFLIDSLEKSTLISLEASTPFGSYIPQNLTASQINIPLAIKSFNESVYKGTLSVGLCNPLSPLNEMLSIYFDKNSWTKKQAERKPIKTEKVTIYDALRNINYYILAFGLEDEIRISDLGGVNVLSSKSGDGINNYLSLSESEKLSILKLISPDEFSFDRKT